MSLPKISLSNHFISCRHMSSDLTKLDCRHRRPRGFLAPGGVERLSERKKYIWTNSIFHQKLNDKNCCDYANAKPLRTTSFIFCFNFRPDFLKRKLLLNLIQNWFLQVAKKLTKIKLAYQSVRGRWRPSVS